MNTYLDFGGLTRSGQGGLHFNSGMNKVAVLCSYMRMQCSSGPAVLGTAQATQVVLVVLEGCALRTISPFSKISYGPSVLLQGPCGAGDQTEVVNAQCTHLNPIFSLWLYNLKN